MKFIEHTKFLGFLVFVLIFSEGRMFAEGVPGKSGSCPAVERADSFLDQIGKPVSVYEDKVRLKIDVETRYRFEYRDDFNFNDRTFEDDAVNLFRNRIGVKIESDFFAAYAQAQDAQSSARSSLQKTSSFENQFDLRQLNFEFKSPSKKIPLAVKVGRQELSYGDQRFVGNFDWSNVARVFDAVKILWNPYSWFKADAWFGQVVGVDPKKADTARHHENFYGLYASLGPWKEQNLDTFLFVKHDRDDEIAGEKTGQRGALKEYTSGNRYKGKLYDFDYGLEWAAQFGSRAHNQISAWAWHNEIGYNFVKLFSKPRLGFEYNHASGDSNPGDGLAENFDNLYPTNHPFYGYMDLASLRNLHDIAVNLKIQPMSRIKLEYAHHWMFLSTNNSAWFNAGQSVIRSGNPAASNTLGQEMDLLMTWAASRHLDFLIGYSHFHAGAFVRDTGASDNANFFYTQTKIKI